MIAAGRRIADNNIYLRERRYRRPKELFKFAASLIQAAKPRPGSSLFDVGCATGEFVYYLRQVLPQVSEFHGMDVSPKLIAAARRDVAGCEFSVGSILDTRRFSRRRYDIVTCMGVMAIFDDFARPLRNLLSCVRPGGLVLIGDIFNDDPIDVIMRYRRSSVSGADWESGWSIHSRHGVERILAGSGYRLRSSWHPFRMPFGIKKRPGDPMRSWTMRTERNPHHVVNGACQMLPQQLLSIRVQSPPTH